LELQDFGSRALAGRNGFVRKADEGAVAGSRPEQLSENLAALDVKLTPEHMEQLNTAGNPDVRQACLR
jgi:aryl-alcohol dehydrogenase-like predicted oxidoreductase